MKDKRGNLQLTESVLVMFFVLVIIAIGLVVFYRFQLNSLHDYENEYREKQIMSMLMTLPNELGYTFMGKSENAIDTSRLFSFGNDYGFKTIILEEVYPKSSEAVDCTRENYPNCNRFIVYDKTSQRFENKLVESRPVSLYYPLEDRFKAGKLIIEWHY